MVMATEEQDRRIVLEFCHLLEKSKQLFNGLRDLPQYGEHRRPGNISSRPHVTINFAFHFRSPAMAGLFRANIRRLHETMEVSTAAPAGARFEIWIKAMANRRNS
jgi:hypothetical protein